MRLSRADGQAAGAKTTFHSLKRPDVSLREKRLIKALRDTWKTGSD